MSTKSHWEARVGLLLDPLKHTQFTWSYKPPDSQMYGGQPRIDWLACDLIGRFWMVEVKHLADERLSINLNRDVTPGQRAALDGVSASQTGVALLAVGHHDTLHWFDWRMVGWQLTPESTNPLLPMADSLLSMTWTGPKSWDLPLYTLLRDRLPHLELTQIVHAVPSPKPVG
jgi:hypothetical protein